MSEAEYVKSENSRQRGREETKWDAGSFKRKYI